MPIAITDSTTIAAVAIFVWLLIFAVWLISSIIARTHKAIKQYKHTVCEYCDKGEKLKDGMHLNAHGIPHALCERLGCMRKPSSS